MEDNFKVIKLVSGEEIVANMVEENDFELKLFFPMLVKIIPRMEGNRIMESITLAPYSYLSGDDIFTIQRNHVMYTQPLDPQFEDQYRLSIDDAIEELSPRKEPNENELQELTDKLKKIFENHIQHEDELDDLIFIEGSKTIH